MNLGWQGWGNNSVCNKEFSEVSDKSPLCVARKKFLLLLEDSLDEVVREYARMPQG